MARSQLTKPCRHCGEMFSRWPKSRFDITNFCSRRCQCAHRTRPIGERFWALVNKSEGCWLWAGSVSSWGYGRFGLSHRKNVTASRLAWILTHGSIPEGQCVLHKCDVPACCNPDHLFLGTHQDNMTDKTRKGRQARNFGMHAGEKSPTAKLTQEQVLEIRQSKEKLLVLANRYGVAFQTISKVRNGNRWRHIPMPITQPSLLDGVAL